MSPKEREALLGILKARFEKHPQRHKGLAWSQVQAKLEANAEKLWSLHEMERTGGEPDVVGHEKKTGEFIFYDCAAESPKGRRSVCYDPDALESRKEHKPKDSAIGMAAAMGIELLTEEEFRELQKLGEFDTKTSSWVKTPAKIRELGGALFCDRRFDTDFRVSQRRGIVLRRPRLPRLAEGLASYFGFWIADFGFGIARHLVLNPKSKIQIENRNGDIDLVRLGYTCTEHVAGERATHVVLTRDAG